MYRIDFIIDKGKHNSEFGTSHHEISEYENIETLIKFEVEPLIDKLVDYRISRVERRAMKYEVGKKTKIILDYRLIKIEKNFRNIRNAGYFQFRSLS